MFQSTSKIILNLIPLLFIGAIWGCGNKWQKTQPMFEVGPIQWGEPVNGLQAGLARKKIVSAPQGHPNYWNPIYIEFHLRNVGDKPIRLIEPIISCHGLQSGRPLIDASFEMTGSETYRIGFMTGPGEFYASVIELEPDQTWSLRGQFGSEAWIEPGMWGLSGPLEGECILSYHNHRSTTKQLKSNESVEIADLWTGDVHSNPLELKIRSAGIGPTLIRD